MSGLIQHGAVIANPIRDPLHHLRRFYLWTSKKRMGPGGVAQKSGRALFKLENWLDAEVLPELRRNVAHREGFRASHIQNQRWRLTVCKRLQAGRVRISLPDHVYKSHPQINGPMLKHRLADVSQHSVTKFDGIIQAQSCDRRAPAIRTGFEHTLPPQC